MRTFLLTIFLSLLITIPGFSQSKYWFFFQDKGPEATWFQSHPEALLSAKALQKRENAGIGISKADLPVSHTYLSQLRGQGLQIEGKSKWLNAVAIDTDCDPKDILQEFDFVTGFRPVADIVPAHLDEDPNRTPAVYPPTEGDDAIGPFDYGQASWQNQMLNVPYLHKKGMTGKGILMAIFDAGFFRVDTLSVFDSLWNEGRLPHVYDFVDQDTTIFDESNHGLAVLSVIGGNHPGKLVGTAPHCSFVLGRTETVSSESRQEEYNWVAGMEWADSLGVDIIHSSLGYNTFDEANENYTYDQLDGNTSIITKAADMAASRGILVTTSAGNEGWSAWQRITAPCDGDSVLCIGSVDSFRVHSSFSSIGPAADGRLKPEVVAMGSRTAVMGKSGRIWHSNGTSYAAPLVAGLAACLMQGHPDRNNWDIMEAIRMSGDHVLRADSLYGFGVPDGRKADSLLYIWDQASTLPVAGPQFEVFIPEALEAKPFISISPCENCAGIQSVFIAKETGARKDKITLKYLPFEASEIDEKGVWWFNKLKMKKAAYKIKVITEDGKEKTFDYLHANR